MYSDGNGDSVRCRRLGADERSPRNRRFLSGQTIQPIIATNYGAGKWERIAYVFCGVSGEDSWGENMLQYKEKLPEIIVFAGF